MACYQPGYKVRMGVRRDIFFKKKQNIISEESQFIFFFPPKWLEEWVKSQHELHSPVFEGLAVLAEVAAEEVAPSQGMGRGGLLPGGCDSELKLTGTHFSKVSSRNRQCRLSLLLQQRSYF